MLQQIKDMVAKRSIHFKPILVLNLTDMSDELSDIRHRSAIKISNKLRRLKDSNEHTAIEDYDDKVDELNRLIHEFSQPLDSDDFLTIMDDLCHWSNELVDQKKVCEIMV